MKRLNLFIAFCLGIVAGYAIGEQLQFKRTLSPDKALQLAKRTLQKYVPIHSSWIYIHLEKVVKNGIIYDVYRGGISRNKDNPKERYTFLIDAKTGTILDIQPPLLKKPPR